MNFDYDLVILGGGPAGLSAGIYSSRARLKTLILEKQTPGGQVLITEKVENYPGYFSVAGYELVDKMVEQVRNFQCEIRMGEVKEIVPLEKGFKLKTADGEITSKSVVIATGRQPRRLNIDGEIRLIGRGVSYCATCDGAFFRDKKVVVVGGGDSAVEEAIFLTKYASEVTIVHRRDELRAAKYLQERAFNNEKIKFLYSHIPLKIVGENFVEGILLKNLKNDKEFLFEVDGVFIFIGSIPNTSFVSNLLKLGSSGGIITDEKMETSVKGIFAAGDVREKFLYQIATAVGEGAVAAVAAEKYIENNF